MCENANVAENQTEGVDSGTKTTAFDFDAHRASAVDKFRSERGTYEDFGRTVQALLKSTLSAREVKVQSIEMRVKSEESFGAKAARASDATGERPKYGDPLSEIQDLAACRIITYFLKDVEAVQSIISEEFDVLELANRSSYLRAGGSPGYQSYHLIVRLSENRLALAEYMRFRGLVAEIQVRTVLQHAWAEIEHDIQYKSVDALPAEIGQRFQALAGLIEIGDREFQEIADSYEQVRIAAEASLEAGELTQVELTADSLRSYLDRKLGPDGRMKDWIYDWTSAYLRRMGFENLQQLDACIDGKDDDKASRAVWGSRQGQISRFEIILLLGVGPARYKRFHPYGSADFENNWFNERVDEMVNLLREAGFEVNDQVDLPNG